MIGGPCLQRAVAVEGQQHAVDGVQHAIACPDVTPVTRILPRAHVTGIASFLEDLRLSQERKK